ncbi:MAG: hypothetical protein FWC86_01360 [Coriobacteriia bacterium]|nr:hypothetical protein [Coriobacteriia bacterium]
MLNRWLVQVVVGSLVDFVITALRSQRIAARTLAHCVCVQIQSARPFLESCDGTLGFHCKARVVTTHRLTPKA